MKKLFITLIALIGFTFIGNAQEKKFEEVNINYYSYTENSIDDIVHQTGFYENIDGELKRVGVWKHYINGELRSVAKFEDDKIISLIIDGVEYSAEDLYIFRKETNKHDVALND